MFITVEGHDYTGKTTQLRHLKRKLEEHGYNVLMLRTPGGSAISEQLRVLANREIDGEKASLETRTLLMTAARIHTHQSKIIPALNTGTIILADRWIWSGYLYQVVGEGENYARWKITNQLMLEDRYLPDLTIVLTLDEEERLRRKNVNARQSIPDITEQQGVLVEKRISQAISDADELTLMTKRLFNIHQEPDDTEDYVSEKIFNQVLELVENSSASTT